MEDTLDISEVFADGIPVFTLSFRSEEETMAFGAVYVRERDGDACLITTSEAGQYAQSGLLPEVKGETVSETAEYLGSSGFVSFFAAPGLEAFSPCQIHNRAGAYFQVLYPKVGSDSAMVLSGAYDLGEFDAFEGYYLLPYAADADIPEGSPALCCENAQVWGLISRTDSGSMMVVDLTEISLPKAEKDTVVGQTAQQESKAEETQRKMPYGAIGAAGVLIAGVVILLSAAGKKKQAKNAEKKKRKPGKKTGGMWRIRCIQGSRCGEVFPLKRTLVIGRAGDADVVFPADTAGVSGKHCRLSVVNGRVFLQDLNSRYGTYAGKDMSERIQPQKNWELKNADIFSISQGGPVFRLEYCTKHTGNSTYGVCGPDGVCYLPDAGNVITIGRRDTSTIRFTPGNTAISANHCKLFMEDGSVYVMDEGSTNGTYFMDHSRLMPHEKYVVEYDTVFYLSDPSNSFRVVKR